MTRDPITEAFFLWPAYQTLHEYLLSTNTRTSDPRDFVGAVCAYGLDRASCLLYAHSHAACLGESYALVTELLDMARDGRRPKFAGELGLRAEDFAS